MQVTRNESGKLDAYAWPGGYPLFYLVADNGVLCPACANGENGSEAFTAEDVNSGRAAEDEQWRIVACDANWEDESLYCDHCNKRIESAYGESES